MSLFSPTAAAVSMLVVGASMAGSGIYLLFGLGWALLAGSMLPLAMFFVLVRGLIRGG